MDRVWKVGDRVGWWVKDGTVCRFGVVEEITSTTRMVLVRYDGGGSAWMASWFVHLENEVLVADSVRRLGGKDLG